MHRKGKEKPGQNRACDLIDRVHGEASGYLPDLAQDTDTGFRGLNDPHSDNRSPANHEFGLMGTRFGCVVRTWPLQRTRF